jgi:hypothetical protein
MCPPWMRTHTQVRPYAIETFLTSISATRYRCSDGLQRIWRQNHPSEPKAAGIRPTPSRYFFACLHQEAFLIYIN